MEAEVEALLATVDYCTPVNIRPCDVPKEIQFLELGIASKCLWHLPRRPLVLLVIS
jgi:hypothetical protein